MVSALGESSAHPNVWQPPPPLLLDPPPSPPGPALFGFEEQPEVGASATIPSATAAKKVNELA